MAEQLRTKDEIQGAVRERYAEAARDFPLRHPSLHAHFAEPDAHVGVLLLTRSHAEDFTEP